MGGATVLLTAALNQNDHLVGVIDDCAYADLYTVFAKELKYRFNLPSFPVLDMANIMARIKAKFNLKDVSLLKKLLKLMYRYYLYILVVMILFQLMILMI